MNTKIIAGVIAFVLIAAGAGIALGVNHGLPQKAINGSTTNTKTPTSSQAGANSSKVLLSNTQYAPYSYMIYPGPVSQQARTALDGFNIASSALQNGTTDVNITLAGTNQYQSIMLKPDYKLYIIETTFGDDGYHFDSSLGDDGFVIVDRNGYIAQ